MAYESSLIAEGFANFKRQEALDLLQASKEHFENALKLYKEGRHEAACGQLVGRVQDRSRRELRQQHLSGLAAS